MAAVWQSYLQKKEPYRNGKRSGRRDSKFLPCTKGQEGGIKTSHPPDAICPERIHKRLRADRRSGGKSKAVCC